jgi:hypothetical protein
MSPAAALYRDYDDVPVMSKYVYQVCVDRVTVMCMCVQPCVSVA